MRTVSLILATMAVALLVATDATPARSEAAAAGTLRLLAVTGPQRGLNGFNFDREPRAGDQIAETDALYVWAGKKRGRRVGRAELILLVKADVGPKGFMSLLTAQAFLPGGSLFVQGYALFGGSEAPSSFPILGGTGRYATARGSLTTHPVGDGRTGLEFRIVS